jgi:superfamily II DNA or RNA helicase
MSNMSGWIWTDTPVVPMASPAASELEFRVHLAAREWSTAPPILIHGPEDIESSKHWSETFTPYHYQVQNLITFCRRAPVALIADDVGLGKTISASLIVSELVTRKKVRRVLVACPSLLLEQWTKELQEKFGLGAEYATGAGFDALLRGKTTVVVTTYDTLRPRIESMAPNQFDLLILDEAHRLRNLHGTKQAPLIATGLKRKLASKAFRYVVMLTATPIQNRLWDLYSLVDMLSTAKGHANPLGDPHAFELDYIADRSSTGRRLNPGYAERFRRILSQYMVRTRRADCRLPFPERQVKLQILRMSEEEQLLERAVRTYSQRLNPLHAVSVAQAFCSSPEALLAQLANMRDTDYTTRHAVQECATRVRVPAKLVGLVAFLRELEMHNPHSWRAVVFTIRKETLYAIQKAIILEFGADSVGLIQGGKAEENRRTIRRFEEETPRMHVVVSTDAGAEGVNLQVANVVVNYDLPWNPMIVEQRIGRVQRLGSMFKHVVVMNLILKGTHEEKVVARLAEKLQIVAQSIGDIESVLESLGGGEDDESFEAMIRRLVLDSLQGKDTTAAVAAQQESIEEAKLLYKESQRTVEETVGALDAMHKAGSHPPRLSEVRRSMTYTQFTEHALRNSGCTLTPITNGFLVQQPGSSDSRIYFHESDMEPSSPGYFGAPNSRLCIPGEPYFERLVGEWTKRSDTWICRAKNDSDQRVDETVLEWLGQFEGCTLETWSITSTKEHSGGTLHLKAEAMVAHDRYETIFATDYTPADPALQTLLPEADHGQPIKNFEVVKALPSVHQLIHQAVERNTDIRAFCEFYIGRRTEELAKAEPTPAAREYIQRSYTPGLAAQLIGVAGVLFRQVSVAVQYQIDGHPGTAELVLVPSTRTVLRHPPLQTCSSSGRVAPASHLEECGVSKRLVLKSLLETCALTGLRALPEHMGTCASTGDRILASQLSPSAISGLLVRKDLMRPSVISGRLALPEEFASCSFTGALIAPDEAAASEVSGRLLRLDQQAASAVSGRKGHVSEFLTCAATGNLILPEESGVSDLSGRRVRHDRLLTSASPPHRRGTIDEMSTCSVSGQQLLRDEVATSKHSGRVAALEHMAKSEVSGHFALRDELVTCEVSAKKLLPYESAVCAVSGLRVDWNLLSSCRHTGDLVLPDGLEASSVSGHMVRKDLLVASQKPPHRKALPQETTTCQLSGLQLLATECEISGISAVVADRDLMRPSDRSGRYGLPAEGSNCEVTGAWLLVDELAQSAVSQKRVDRTLLTPCEQSGALCLDDELETSIASGLMVRKDLLVAADKPPHSRALPFELVTCTLSGMRLLPQDTDASIASGARADRGLMVWISHRKGRALPSEVGRCQITDRTMLLEELGHCQETNKLVGRNLLGLSETSGRKVLASLLVNCAESGTRLLPSELQRCSMTGAMVSPKVLQSSAVSGRMALRRTMLESVVSGRLMLPGEEARSARSGGIALPEEMITCGWSGRLHLPSESGACSLTGVVQASEMLGPDGAGLQLRRVLDGTGGTPNPPPQLIAHLRSRDPKILGELRDIHWLASPDGDKLAFCGQHRSMFGLRSRWIGGYFQLRPQADLLGTIVSGVRKDGRWMPAV